ncbi:MAG: PadR family transcriptional regulator [Sneathiella sp.]
MSTNLREALIGLLLEQPNHAYALKQLLAPRVSPSDTINDGVLYPLLRKLEKDGLIAGREDISPSNRKRTIYTVTKKGQDWFMAWLSSSANEEDTPAYDFFLGNPLLVKVQFFELLSAVARRQKLSEQLRRTKSKLKQFSDIRIGMVERAADPFRISLLDLGIAQQKTTRRWLQTQLKLLSKESGAP